MADCQHTMGSDWTVSANGDLALSTGTQEGQERVLRRLLTPLRAYIWHLDYGAGLPSFVGQVAHKARIEAVARSQMYREDIVARSPAPVIGVDIQPTGVVTLNIKYTDTITQEPVNLIFNVPG